MLFLSSQAKVTNNQLAIQETLNETAQSFQDEEVSNTQKKKQ